MAINEGSYVYVRAIATNRVRFYEDGIQQDRTGITVEPINKQGERYDYIEVPSDSVVSADAAKWAIRKQIEREGG